MAEESERRPTCFVIQTFDEGKYDKRYHETIYPALIKANVEPQRADEILGLNPVIEKIETAITAASICVAEVSEDNPNVWLELGYALALGRPTVILCDKSIRSRLPFDVQHRPIILYRTDSRSGYEELEASIIKWVTNELKMAQRISQAPILKAGSEGCADLEPYEVAVLSTTFAFWPTSAGGATYWELEKKLKGTGYTDVALALGISGLLSRDLLSDGFITENDSGSGSYEIKHFFPTPKGIQWLHDNRKILEVRTQCGKSFDDLANDIPF